jgi:hypothetical protein
MRSVATGLKFLVPLRLCVFARDYFFRFRS